MDPARMYESLTPRPELENSQGHYPTYAHVTAFPLCPSIADIEPSLSQVR
jgi:hypothetical protein